MACKCCNSEDYCRGLNGRCVWCDHERQEHSGWQKVLRKWVDQWGLGQDQATVKADAWAEQRTKRNTPRYESKHRGGRHA